MSLPVVLLPPFSEETARAKVRAAEDAWNSRDPVRVARSYSQDSEWRNRSTFLKGREQLIAFLEQKWRRELEYRLAKALWSVTDNRIAVRFRYEYHDASGQWFRAYGNELWEFSSDGLMQRREASINDVAITESERTFRWSAPGPRPSDDRSMDSMR